MRKIWWVFSLVFLPSPAHASWSVEGSKELCALQQNVPAGINIVYIKRNYERYRTGWLNLWSPDMNEAIKDSKLGARSISIVFEAGLNDERRIDDYRMAVVPLGKEMTRFVIDAAMIDLISRSETISIYLNEKLTASFGLQGSSAALLRLGTCLDRMTEGKYRLKKF